MSLTRPYTISSILIFSAVLAAGHEDLQDGGASAPGAARKPPKSLKVAAVQFRSSRDLDKNVAISTADREWI